jgi:hypothetical protein
VSGDFDGDGYEDLAYPCQYGGELHVLLGDGTGHFSAPGIYTMGEWPIDLAARDLDLDGDLDLVVCNEASEELMILRNDVPGAGPGEIFTLAATIPLTTPFGITVEDLDGDRLPDIAVATRDSARVVVMQAGCQPGEPRLYATGGGWDEKLRALTVIDYDGDGDEDLVVTNSDANCWVLMENDGAGNLTSIGSWPTGDRPIQPMVVDLDDDGTLDVIVAARRDGTGYVYTSEHDPAGVAEPPSTSAVAGITASPNPFRESVLLRLLGVCGERLEILDVTGRSVRVLALPLTDAGSSQLMWDGRDRYGRPVPPGTYFLRAAGREGPVRRLLRLR